MPKAAVADDQDVRGSEVSHGFEGIAVDVLDEFKSVLVATIEVGLGACRAKSSPVVFIFFQAAVPTAPASARCEPPEPELAGGAQSRARERWWVR